MKLIILLATLTVISSSIAVEPADTSSNGSEIIPYIVGGVNASRHEFPWLVNLRLGANVFCGGALIYLDIVLTAAHCVKNVSAMSITVVAGDHDLGVKENTEQNSTVQAVKYHELYNEYTLQNDIALLKLSKNLTQNVAVRPISLPPANFNVNTSINATVAGWGKLRFNATTISNILQKVTVPIVSNTACRSAYLAGKINITNDMICAGQSGKDSCQGDSGGPLICSAYPGTVCGIVSFGIGCASPQYPGVYTKVSSYITWIDANRNSTIVPPPGTTTTRTTTTTIKTTTKTTTKKPGGSDASQILPGFYIVPLLALFLSHF